MADSPSNAAVADAPPASAPNKTAAPIPPPAKKRPGPVFWLVMIVVRAGAARGGAG